MLWPTELKRRGWVSLLYRAATTNYLCCDQALEDSKGAGRIGLTRFAVAKVGIFFESTNFLQIFYEILFDFKKMLYLCTRKTETECSAVGSALRSGRRGRAFESPHSDTVKDKPLIISGFLFF